MPLDNLLGIQSFAFDFGASSVSQARVPLVQTAGFDQIHSGSGQVRFQALQGLSLQIGAFQVREFLLRDLLAYLLPSRKPS